MSFLPGQRVRVRSDAQHLRFHQAGDTGTVVHPFVSKSVSSWVHWDDEQGSGQILNYFLELIDLYEEKLGIPVKTS